MQWLKIRRYNEMQSGPTRWRGGIAEGPCGGCMQNVKYAAPWGIPWFAIDTKKDSFNEEGCRYHYSTQRGMIGYIRQWLAQVCEDWCGRQTCPIDTYIHLISVGWPKVCDLPQLPQYVFSMIFLSLSLAAEAQSWMLDGQEMVPLESMASWFSSGSLCNHNTS